ncbi:Cell death abnormality protein 1 [Diplonema papillatum]|nr:Cell death abnormality protein 1 [Diplonema papillatum]
MSALATIAAAALVAQCRDEAGVSVCCDKSDCKDAAVACPHDADCRVICKGNACTGARITCPEWGSCEVECTACTDVAVTCPRASVGCTVACSTCRNVTVSRGVLLCGRANACDDATIAQHFGAAGLAPCAAEPPARGPQAASAFKACGSPHFHGQSCTDACEGNVFQCVNGSWAFGAPAQCGRAPYDCGGNDTLYRLIAAGVECSSVDISLQPTSDPATCASQCLQTPGCKFFAHAPAALACKWEQTQAASCPEGFVPAAGDASFFEPVAAVAPCNGRGDCTADGCACFAAAATGHWAGVFCEACAEGYASGGCDVPCAGGACSVCGGRGWCDSGFAGDGSCECGEGWAAPSCTECAEAFFGPFCRGTCPVGSTGLVCSLHGDCLDGRTGNGTCVCERGWAAPLCDTCDETHWGDDCSGSCPGLVGPCSRHGACNKTDGRCTCGPGWAGPACELVCTDCGGHGACVASDPPCLCDEGWAPPDCSQCAEGYAGGQCTTICPGMPEASCGGHGVCSVTDAKCTCDPGWFDHYTYPCNVSCPLGRNGAPCNGQGTCSGPDPTAAPAAGAPASAAPAAGLPEPPAYRCTCNPEWSGDDCSACAFGRAGRLCDQQCPGTSDATRTVCSGRGECIGGRCYCIPSACGAGCETVGACPRGCGEVGLFGEACDRHCPGYPSTVCAGHGVCDAGKDGTGVCLCYELGVWGGASCDVACPSVNGLPCSGTGECVLANATCACKPGYVGADCSRQCPMNTLGVCSGRGDCDSTGTCVCSSAWGGEACTVYCGCVEGHGSCNGTTSACECFASFKGTTCRDCADGFHGETCSEPCVHGSSQAQQCKCDASYSGPHCDHRCPTDANGRICSNKGTCLSGSDREVSSCVCLSEWYGPACDKQCTASMCAAQYPFGSSVCGRDGSCVCDAQHQGQQCSECSDGYWGSACQKPCPCEGRGSCDRVTGACVCYDDDAKGHFAGDLCESCADGHTGLPHCVTKSVPITKFNEFTSSVMQATTSRLVLVDEVRGLGWLGGNPPVFWDLNRQKLGGVALLDACQIVEGWEYNGQFILLADPCRLYSQPRLLRAASPPPAGADWDSRTGTPWCTAQTPDVCLLYEFPAASLVVDASWKGNDGPLVVLFADATITVLWLDRSGIPEVSSEADVPASSLSTVTTVASVEYNSTFHFAYVCGLTLSAPGWACYSVFANRTTPEVVVRRKLQWLSAPNCVSIPDATTQPDGVLLVSLGYTPPGGSAVGIVQHVYGTDTVSSTSLVKTSTGENPSVLAADRLSGAVYAVTTKKHATLANSHTIRVSRIARAQQTNEYLIGGEIVFNDTSGPSAMAVDATRRLVYLLPTDADGTRIHVLSAFCANDAYPGLVRYAGGSILAVRGFGYYAVPVSESEPACYFVDDEILAATPQTVNGSGSLASSASLSNESLLHCTTPPVSSSSCGRIDLRVSLFDPIGSVAPYIASCGVSVYPYSAPRLVGAVPSSVPLGPGNDVILQGFGLRTVASSATASLLLCRDEAARTWAARYINSTHVACPQVPFFTPAKEATLQVSVDGGAFFTNAVPVQYVGERVGLVARIDSPEVPSSVPYATLPGITVYTVDEDGNPLLERDSGPRVLVATLLFYTADPRDDERQRYDGGQVRDVYKAFEGTLSVAMEKGVGRFENLRIAEARAGTASVAIATPGLDGAFASVAVTAGEPRAVTFLREPYAVIHRPTGQLVQGDLGGAGEKPTAATPVLGLVDAFDSQVRRLPPGLAVAASVRIVPTILFGNGTGDPDSDPPPAPVFNYTFDARGEAAVVDLSSALLHAVNAVAYRLNATSEGLGSVVSRPVALQNCPVGSYMVAGAAACAVCPAAGVCDGTARIETKRGYWAAAGEYYACRSAACIGGDACDASTAGPRCGSCRSGWVDTGVACAACLPAPAMVFFLVLLVAVKLLVYALWVAFVAGHRGAAGNPLHGVLFCSFLYLQCDGTIGNVRIPEGWIREFVLWEYRVATGDIVNTPASGCVVRSIFGAGNERLFAVVYYLFLPLPALAIAALARRVMRFGAGARKKQPPPPPPAKPAREDSPAAPGDKRGAAARESFGDASQQVQAGGSAGGKTPSREEPCAAALARSSGSVPRPADGEGEVASGSVGDLASFKDVCRCAWVAVWFTQLHPMAMADFDALACESFETAAGGAVDRLAVDTRVDCGGTRAGLAWFSLVLYLGLGGAAAAAWQCKRGGDAKLDFLTGPFREGRRWWWGVAAARRVFLALIVRFGAGAASQVLLANAVNLAVLLATAALHPWEGPANSLDLFLCSISVASGQLTIHESRSPFWLTSVLIILLRLLAVGVILYCLWTSVRSHFPGAIASFTRKLGFAETKAAARVHLLAKSKKRPSFQPPVSPVEVLDVTLNLTPTFESRLQGSASRQSTAVGSLEDKKPKKSSLRRSPLRTHLLTEKFVKENEIEDSRSEVSL